MRRSIDRILTTHVGALQRPAALSKALAERGQWAPEVLTGLRDGVADVVRRQEVTFSRLVRQGFTLPDATRGLVLLHDFTIGFCVEEQAVAQVTAAGDDRYSPGRRAELIGPQDAPLAAEAGWVIFGDPDTRFAELVGMLLDTVARLLPGG